MAGQEIELNALIDAQPLSALQILAIALCSSVALLDGIDTQSIGVAAPLIAEALVARLVDQRRHAGDCGRSVDRGDLYRAATFAHGP